MGLARKILLVLMILTAVMMICETSNGETHEIGWGYIDIHHSSWLAKQNFRVGDTIVFYYDPFYDDVLQVTRENFETCNFTNPITTWLDDTGIAVFNINEHGHFYFLNSVGRHCEDESKVDIYVPEPFIPVGPAPSPLSNGPSTPEAHAPTPSSSPNGISYLDFIFQRFGH